MDIQAYFANANSIDNYIFILVMCMLYGAALLAGVSYKAMNIYVHFVLFALSFALFFKCKW